ncbi:hypothetical protein [Spiroplasma endosymbiont of Poecilobothrus nobilitatus]|uniref:hypothetical protein n=1 Tax=Spiroplasma endosymbiont of Poecilobothrus nobilitatus TaxID=1209220 RepID=UPI00313CA3B9
MYRAQPKHDCEVDDDLDVNQDLDILNHIKKEVNQALNAWWQTKATIDINDYPDQVSFFTELVDELKKENDSLTLTGKEISSYRVLKKLFVGFKAEFDNLNQSLRDRYSNYYVDTIPLFLMEDDISFTLYNINFYNIAKLLEVTSEVVLGITVRVDIYYEVRFKGLQARDNIETIVVITNDLDALSNIQDKLEAYFIKFIDEIFKGRIKKIRVLEK